MPSASTYDELADRLETRSATVGVIGVGYIGLPTAAILASEGYRVIGFDIDEKKVRVLNSGGCYIDEPDLPWIVSGVVDAGRLVGTTDFRKMAECDVLMFCTQTPLKSDGTPNLDILFSAVDCALEHARPGILIICESTVPPGTTQRIVERFVSTGSFQLDKSLWAAHCPERVLPGKVVQELRTNDRVIGGITPASATLARKLYESFLDPDRIMETRATVSEFAKLAENTYRDVNIALANEMAIAADLLGIDITEVIALANRHPRVNIHRPGVGVGGHCLPKDPILLSTAVTERGGRLDLTLKAREINSAMPRFAVSLLERVVGSDGLKDRRVLVLGITFKEDVDDTRNSPSKVLIEELRKRGAFVRAHDPKTDERFGADNVTDLKSGIDWAEAIVLAVAHSEYRIALPRMDLQGKVFLDGRNIFSPSEISAGVYLGIGRPVRQ